MKGSRFSEEQIIGVLRERGGRGEDRRGMPAAGDLRARHFTSMDGSPVARRFRVLF